MGWYRWKFGWKVYYPDKKDIARECKKIQATWSPEERERRRARRVPGWLPPVVSTEYLRERLDRIERDGEEDIS